ncbi:MAG: hypothetical protein ACTSUE_01835 [Promethearchaeota archaeon]
MSTFQSWVLSQFSSIEGPQVFFLVSNGFVSENLKEEISSVLNLNVSKDYFIFRIGNITSYNIQFEIKSCHARGNKELLMLSFITDRFPLKKVERYFHDHAKGYIHYLKSNEVIGYIFHLNKTNDMSDDEFKMIEVIYEESLERLRIMLQEYART